MVVQMGLILILENELYCKLLQLNLAKCNFLRIVTV